MIASSQSAGVIEVIFGIIAMMVMLSPVCPCSCDSYIGIRRF